MKRIVFSVTVFFCAWICTAAVAADWNQWRGAQRNGVADDSRPLISQLPADGLKPLWLTDKEVSAGRSGGWSSPVVADGHVFVFTHQKNKTSKEKVPERKFPWLPPEKRVGMSDEEYQDYERKRRDEEEAQSKFFQFVETTYCLDAATGKLIWRNDNESVYTRFSQSGSPAVVDGKVFVLGAARFARCIDATSGKDLWEQKLPGEFRDEMLQSSFTVIDGVAVILAIELFGLDADSGKILWQTSEDTDRQVHSSAVEWKSEKGSRAICNIASGKTICIDVQTGDKLWEINSMANHSTPIVVDDLLLTYGSSRKSGLRCFRISDSGAEHQWTCNRTADSGSSPVVVGDHVYVQGERRLACVNLSDGKAAWMTNLDMNRPRYTSLIAADGKVFYGFEGVLAFAASADKFQQLMNAKVDATGLLADEQTFRKMLKMDELEKTAEGQAQAERLWRDKIGKSGPVACTTPAIANGKMYVRLKQGIACYDLSASSGQ